MSNTAANSRKPARKSFGISRSFIGALSRNLVLATLAAVGLGRAEATDYTWDPNVDGNGVIGGAGTWNLTSPFWDPLGNDSVAADNIVWPNSSFEGAIFGGTGGIVTINNGGVGVTAAGLTFNSGGYTLNSFTAGDLLDLENFPVVTVTNVGQTATINANITGFSGLMVTGAGTLSLTGANNLSGGTFLNVGSNLSVKATGASTTVTGTGVTTAVVNNPLGTGTLSLGTGSTLTLNPLATINQNGLSGRVFSGAPLNNDTSNVDFTATASGTRFDTFLNRPDLVAAVAGNNLTPNASVAVQWTGKLQITNAGAYRFFTASDDGSRVFIDGVLVVQNDGSKGTTDLGSAAVTLSAGLHDVRVDYAQGGGGASEILSWAGGAGLDTGASETAIPTTALFAAESNTTARGSNAVVIGAGNGDDVLVNGTNNINLNGTMFTQAQLGGLTTTANGTLNVSGLAGKTLRFSGTTSLVGTLTINSTPNVALDGSLSGTGVTIVKQGAGRLIFDQTSSTNSIDSTSVIEAQGGTLVLVGGGTIFNPIGQAGLKLNGGNIVLDSKSGGRTFDNAINVVQSGTIQDIIAGVGPINTILGSATNGISIASGQTLTLDAIAGGNNLASNPAGSTEAGAQITVAGAVTGAGNLNAISTSFGNTVVPGVVVLSNAGNTFAGNISINGTTITTNTLIPVNGPTLRPTVAGALPAGAGNGLFVQSGTLDLATNNLAYAPQAVVSMGGGPNFTTSNINIGTSALTLNNNVVFDATNNAGTATIKGNGATSGILDLNTASSRTFTVGDSTGANFDLVVNAVVAATGGGGFIKAGPGTMALQANLANQANTYAGLTEVAGGTLFVGGGALAFNNGAIIGNIQVDSGATLRWGAGNVLGDITPVVTVNGTGVWDLNGFGETTGSAAGNGIITASNPSNLRFDLGNNAFAFTGSVTGQVTLGLSGRNATAPVTVPTSQFASLNYYGNTIIGDQNFVATTGALITLQLSANNALPSGFGRGDLVIGSGASGGNKGVLDLNGFNQTVNGLTGVGAVLPVITNNGATDAVLTFGAGATVASSNTFAGLIQDGTTNKVGLAKIGLGTEILSTANTYTGVTTINAGVLTITNATALGSVAGGTVINSGGVLNLPNLTVAEPLTITGAGQPVAITSGAPGPMMSGALTASGGIAGTLTGSVTLGGNASIGVATGSALTITTGITDGGFGYGLTKTLGNANTGGAPATIGAGGTLVLTGASTYTGATTIEAGEIRLANAGGQAIASTVVNIGDQSNNGTTLTLGANNQMASNVIVNFNNGNQNAKFQLNGFNQTVAGFSSSGTLAIIQNFETGGGGTSTLTVNNPTDTSFNGFIRDQTGTVAITKAGAGTLTLSGIGASATNVITYQGATSVTAGKLVLQDTTAFNSPITVSGTGSLEFNLNYGRTLTYGKVLNDGALGFTKSGPGNLVLSVADAVTGQVNVTGGSLILNSVAAASPITGATINVSAGAQLDLYGVTGATTYSNNVILNGMSPGGALAGSVTGGTPVNTLSGTLTLNATSNVTTGWSDKTINLTGIISGPGGLVLEKMNYTQNQPIFNLANSANSFNGDLTIRAGTVFSAAAGTALGNGNLNFNGSAETVLTTASAAETTFGAVSGGLVLGTNGQAGFTRAIGTGAGQVQFTGEGGGFSAIGSAQTVNFGGAAGSVDWGAAGFSGSAGLYFNAANGLGGASTTAADNAVTVVNDMVFSGGGLRKIYVNDNTGTINDRITFSGALSGTGGILKDGTSQGLLVLSGAAANTFTGLTNVSLGNLALNKAAGTNAIGGDLQIGGLLTPNLRRIVYLGANEQIPDTATVTFVGATNNNGDLRLFGFSETVGAIQDRSGSGIIEISEVGDTGFLGTAINTALSSVLTVGGTVGSPVNSDSFFNGFFRTQSGGTGTLGLIKNGSGTLTLSQGAQTGNNSVTYNGPTTINAGAVVYSNLGTYNSAITVASGANVGFNTNINQSLTENQIISGAGNLFKNGIGTEILSGANAYSGTTTVNAGTLNITGTTNASQTGGYTINSGGTLLIGNGTTGGVLTANNAITINANGTLAFSRNNAYNFSGVISGGGNVESRAGGAATILSGANTYSGTTTVLTNSLLTIAGSGISAGGLIVNSGGTLLLDFTQANSNAAGIVAATAPVTLNGGTLSMTGGAAASTQTLGPVALGVNTFVNGGLGASTVNLTAGAVSLNANFGAFTHSTGGTANLVLPVSGGASSTGTAVGGLLSGFTTTTNSTTWVAEDGSGVLSALAAYDVDTYGAGKNTDVTTSLAGASTNSLRFNTAAANTVTLSGANTIASGGILVTTVVGNNASVITGGTLAGSSTAGLTIIQGNAANSLTIGSGIIDNGGATGLTKAGTGTLVLSGANSYSGSTYVAAGTLITSGTSGGGAATVATGATLQVGDGTTNGIVPSIQNQGIVIINNGTAQTLPIYQAGSNFNFLANAISNPTTFQTGSFQKSGAGTLTINTPLLTNTFHTHAGLTVLDTGANVQVSNFSSLAINSADVATLTAKGAARFTMVGDFNVSDLTGSRSTLNIQDQAVFTLGNLFVGKTGVSVGVVNQTLGTVVNSGGSNDWRIGGNGTAGQELGAYGIYNISGGSFQTGRNFQTGASGIGVFNQTGGTVSVTGGTPDAGRQTGSFGLINLSNGTYTHSTTSNLISGESGTGTLNVSGNAQLIFSNVTTANAGLALGGATGDGTVNLLSGGLIVAGQVRDFDASTATASKFNFNGGVLRVQAATVNAATYMQGLTSATVYAGGANIDTNGVATTIAQPLIVPAGSGLTTIPVGTGGSGYVGEPIVNITGGGGVGATARATIVGGVITGFTITNPGTGYTSAPTIALLGGGSTSAGTAGTATFAANATTGGLNKLNTGVLTLTGASTYGGATTITGGSINEAFSATVITNLLPANGLVINGGGLTLTGFAGGTNAQTFSGTAVNGVGTIVSNIGTGGTMTTTLGALTPTTGAAVDFSGTGTINTLSANTGTTILGGWATFGGGANWAVSAGTGAVAGNITALGSYTANTWAAGNNTDMTAATGVSTLTTNSVRFNSATPFLVTVTGTDTITTGGILITPAETTAGTIFTGGTINSGGTGVDLVVNHFGTGAATIVSAIGNLTGGLVKSGSGVLILGSPTTTNAYTGATTIGAGTLRLTVAEQIPNASNVTISAGASLDVTAALTETIGGLSGYGSVVNSVAGTATLNVGGNNASSTFSGLLVNGTGNLALTKTGTGTLTLNNVLAGSFTGATTITAGAIKIATPLALQSGTTINVNVANGLLFDTDVPQISGLAGNSTFALQTTPTSAVPNAPVMLTVGNNNVGGTYSGALTGTGTLFKIGTGFQTLSGANTSTGGFVANGGILEFSGNNSGASGSIFVNSGGTVQFKATNSFLGASGRNVVVASGGIVTAGSVTANSTSTGFGAITPLLARLDQGSTGVLALQTDGSLQTAISENLDFSASAPVSLGSTLTATSGFGNGAVVYTGVITPNANTFRVGGGSGRLILPNASTFSGANSMVLYGGGSTGGLVYLTGAYGYTGATTVNAGVTYITNLANGGSGSSLGAASSAASNLVFNGGTLSYIGSGSSTDRLFTLASAPTALDASGTGPVNFTNTGALGFLNPGARTFTLQGQNTGTNTLAAAIGDSINLAGNNGSVGNNGITTLQKNGNGTWVLSGNNTFSGGVIVNNGVLEFNSANSFGGFSVNGPATVTVQAGGAAAFGPALAGSVQTSLQRIAPASTGTVALTTDTNENLNFDGGAGGATLPQAFLGAYGNVNYTGTLTPFGGAYHLGGGGGVLTMPNGGLTGPRQVVIGGGGPGTGFANNPNLNGAVVLGGTSDYSGGTSIVTGAVLSATSVTALGSGPLKFHGGFYRAVDTTDITLASDGVSARDIRIGFESNTNTATANIDVVSGVNVTFSKTFGAQPTYGSNQPQAAMSKFGAGTLVLAQGLNLSTSSAVATGNAGTLTIERGTLSIQSNPTFFNGLIQVGSNNGGVGTLKLGGNNVFGTGTVFASGSIVDTYSGSKVDLNGFSDTIRLIRGFGSIVNTGAPGAVLTVGTNNEQGILGGNLVGDFTLVQGGNVFNTLGASGSVTGLELWNNNNMQFTGKLAATGGALRIRADGTLGSPTEAFKADKITLSNGATLISGTAAFVPIVIGANHGITLGTGGGTLSAPNAGALIVNSPITGSGKLIIGDETGTVFLASDNNNYTGGTIISSANSRGILSIGAGGATGSLPAGDVYFNTAASVNTRLYFFKSTALSVPNNINGNGIVLQVGAGTTTMSGNVTTNQATWVGGGRLKVDFSGGNAPVGVGTALNINGGAFEYVAPAGDNALRLGALSLGGFTAPPSLYTGGLVGDSLVQSTYGGSGNQNLIFSSVARANTGSTLDFRISGGTNGTTNRISASTGTVNSVLGAAFYYNGADFAALDSAGYVRAANFGADVNTAPINTLIPGRYSKLTTSLINQGSLAAVSGIELAGPGVNLNFASTGQTGTSFTLNGNPAAILKSGGGTSVISGGTFLTNITTGATTPMTLNNSAQELILRTDAVGDTLQIDMPIVNTTVLTKSGNGTLILTAANTFTGNTFINSGTVTVTGNGTLGTATAGTSVRIANSASSTAVLNIDSATASITAGLNTQGDSLRIGEAGNGTLNQSAGTVTANQFVTIGDNLGATGTYNMSGGTLSVKNNNSTTPAFVIGRAGTGTFNLSGSAAVSVKNGAQVLLGSGTVTTTAVLFQSATPNAALSTGVGIINQTGGSLTVDTNNNAYQSNVYGGVILGMDGAGTYNLNGGTLTTPILARGNGTATFNLGGGTLKAPSTVATLPQSIFNVDLAVNVTGTGAGKGTFDTNGNDVSVTGNVLGAGGFVKAGTGALNVLGKANNYAGGTDINAGSVVASGTGLGTGVVNIGAAGTLQVQGLQQGLLAKFQPITTTQVNPAVTNGAAQAQATEFSSFENFTAFTDGRATIAVESTAARGKTSVNYLEMASAGNQNTALPPAVVALNTGGNPFIANLGGKFNAATAGDYTFQTRSDDGNGIWIDGQPVLDNNRAQGQTTRTGTIALTAGLHDIVIGYFQGAGGGGFSIGVTLPNQGQSYTSPELNLSNSLLSFGSNDIVVGGLAGSGNVQMAAGNVTVNTATGVTPTFAGIFNGVAGSGLIKTGLGTQTITGNSSATFSGPTAVNAGTLVVNGSLSGSAVTVNFAGYLGGTGTVGSVTANAGGVVEPATIGTTGTLNTGSVSLLTGSTYGVDLGATTTGAYDQINAAGSISLSGSLSLNLVSGFSGTVGDTYYVFLNDGAEAVTGTFSNDVGGTITMADGHVFNVNYGAAAPAGDGGANDVSLTLAVVPEPGSAMLLLGGFGLLAAGRRTRRRA